MGNRGENENVKPLRRHIALWTTPIKQVALGILEVEDLFALRHGAADEDREAHFPAVAPVGLAQRNTKQLQKDLGDFI